MLFLVAVSQGDPLAAGKGFSLQLCYRAWVPGHVSSEVAPLGSRAQGATVTARGLSCPVACGIFLD